ncbi:MAG: protein kinase, partial [Leptolyngbya sp. SIO3F4]|nr:protein kinase [Leptolyngbya sp. SIO3F4]
MGVVYEAVQDRPSRRVALKLLNQRLVSAATQRRFAFEAEVLGRLRHPNIAQIYEAGVSDDGTPYIAMELVSDARTIVDDARARRLDRSARIERMLSLCAAVEHGHRRGVVHRDIKPANV